MSKHILLSLFLLIGLSQGRPFAQDPPEKLYDLLKSVKKPRENILVLDFWASWCGPCRESFFHLKEVEEKFRDQGVTFFSISVDRSKLAWQKALTQENLPWKQYRAAFRNEFALIKKYFPHKTIPSIFIVSQKGKIIKVKDREKLDEKIRSTLMN